MKKSNNFFLNAFALIGSSTISQIIAVVASIVEARLYTPNEMGIYSTYIAILAVLTVIVCFQYERSIVLINEDTNAKEMVSLCATITILLSISVFVATITLSKPIASLLNIPELSVWIKFLPISLLIAGIIAIMTYWNIKKTNLKLIATINIVTVMCVNLCQIAFGVKRIHIVGGMIIGHLIGNSIAAILYLIKSNINVAELPKPNSQLLKRYKQFPLFSVPATFLDTLGANSPNLLLAFFFNASVTGYYSLGYRLLSVPVSVICSSIAQAFLPDAVEANRNKTLNSATRKIFSFVLKVGLVPLLLIALVSKELIVIVFGEAWSYSASFIPWLCFWLLLGMLYSPISNILIVLERQQDGLIINIISITVKVLTLTIGGMLKNAPLAVALCSVSSGLVSFFACLYIMKLVKVGFKSILKTLVINIVKSAAFVMPTIVALLLFENPMIKLVVGVINGVVFAFIFGKDMLLLLKHKQ